MKPQTIITNKKLIDRWRTILSGAVASIALTLALFATWSGFVRAPGIGAPDPIRSLAVRAGRYYDELRLIYRVNVEPTEANRGRCDSEGTI